MSKPVYTITKANVRAVMLEVWQMVNRGLEGGDVILSLGRNDQRSTDQNSKLWPMLADISKQVEWHGSKPNPEEWKHIFTAALSAQKCYPGIEGGLVFCGISTSRMNKAKFSDLIELMYSFGSEKGVRWSEPALKAYEEWGNGD